jgi:hypothetical protein
VQPRTIASREKRQRAGGPGARISWVGALEPSSGALAGSVARFSFCSTLRGPARQVCVMSNAAQAGVGPSLSPSTPAEKADSGRVGTARPSLVMKGSPVRVRASALSKALRPRAFLLRSHPRSSPRGNRRGNLRLRRLSRGRTRRRLPRPSDLARPEPRPHRCHRGRRGSLRQRTQ